MTLSDQSKAPMPPDQRSWTLYICPECGERGEDSGGCHPCWKFAGKRIDRESVPVVEAVLTGEVIGAALDAILPYIVFHFEQHTLEDRAIYRRNWCQTAVEALRAAGFRSEGEGGEG